MIDSCPNNSIMMALFIYGKIYIMSRADIYIEMFSTLFCENIIFTEGEP